MTAEEFAALVPGARRNPSGGYVGRCRAHDDQRASLSWRDGDANMLLKCHAGCTFEAIATAFGVSPDQLRRRDTAPAPTMTRRVVASYDYTDERGALLYQAVRREPKDFLCRRPDGAGGWIWNLKGVRPVPYRLHELADAPRVYVVEGEKDADALAAVWLTATTNHGGAGKWRAEHTAALVAAAVPEVVILPDTDEAGEKHAAVVARACLAAGLRVKRVDLPGLGPVVDKHGKDVSDWFAAGHTAAELEALAEAAPILEPGADRPVVVAAAGEAWPAPEPVPDDLPPVPAFDAGRLLPPSFAPWVTDIAERAQCPVDFVAVAAVVGAGAVLGRRLAIRPKQHDDWTVVPNLWGAAIGPPGVMKTPALHEALKPLHRLVAEARAAHQEQMTAHRFLQAKDKARRDALAKRLKKAVESNEPTDDLEREFAAPGYTAPIERRYVVNDATVERLGELLAENPNGLLLFRDELVGWLRTMDREGHENDRAFFCEAWDGLGASYTTDRIGRGKVYIESACVSVLGGITPGPLHGYLREIFGEGLTDDGLIQRFQLMVYPDIAPTWTNVDRWPNAEAKQRVFDIFQALARLDAADLGGHPGDPAFLRFDVDAQALADAWRAPLELRLHSGREPRVMQSHLSKYRSLLPSLALLFHVIDCVNRGVGGPVSAEATQRAIAWIGYLEAHARRVYESVTAAAKVATACLAGRVKNGEVGTPFTAREIRRKGWTGLTTAEEIFAALDGLEGLHWLRGVRVGTTTAGGRPTTEYHINPALVAAR